MMTTFDRLLVEVSWIQRKQILQCSSFSLVRFLSIYFVNLVVLNLFLLHQCFGFGTFVKTDLGLVHVQS